MRALVFTGCLVIGLAAHACDSSYGESNGEPPPADGGPDAAATETGPAADAGVDQSAACEGEPAWATTASAQTTVTCGGVAANLLLDPLHCGRCDHSCGADPCVAGNCAERKEDSDACILAGAVDGAVFYARRPGGSFSTQAHEVKRFVPGVGPQVLGSLDVDGSDEKVIRGLGPTSELVYVRTNTALRRTSATLPSSAVPQLIATLPEEAVSHIAGAVDRVYVAMPSGNRIDQVFLDGGVSPFLSATPYANEMHLSAARFLWLSQPFVFVFQNGASSVHLREGTTDKVLYESQDKVGGIAVDGNELWVMRAGPSGAIMHIDLTTTATTPFYMGDLDNPNTGIAVTVDTTHVYWLAGPQGEIWKRARCGGAAVKIGRHPNAYRLALAADRLYVGAEDGLYSIAK